MRGGGHIDMEATDAADFADPRSYIQLVTGKIFLFGDDMSAARKRVYERDRRRCVDCHRRVTLDTMELSHQTPRSLGGDDSDSNLRTRDTDCHRKRDLHGCEGHF